MGLAVKTNENATVEIEIPEWALTRLTALSKKTGTPIGAYALEALLECLQDFEDDYEADQQIEDLKAGRSYTVTLDALEAEFGLDN